MKNYDLEGLEKEARGSALRSAYLQVHRDEDHRLGVCVEIGPHDEARYRLELLVCILRPHTGVDPDKVERGLRIIKWLAAQGFALMHDDDGWFSAEKMLSGEEVRTECVRILEYLKNGSED